MSRRAERLALGAPSSCVEDQPAARRGSVQGSPRLKAVLSVFWAIFHAGNIHFRANRGGAARCEQPGVRGVARGGARAQRGHQLQRLPARLVCYTLSVASPLVLQ